MNLRAALLVALLATPLAAQVPVVPKDGDDASAVAPCPLISTPIRFCGASPEFVLTPQTENDTVASYFATPEGIQSVAIIEDIGLRDGLTIPVLQHGALRILAANGGQDLADLPILERAVVDIAGEPRPNFVYSGLLEGQPIVYSNSMILLDATLAQLVTLEVGETTYSPRHRDLHMRFLANVQVLP